MWEEILKTALESGLWAALFCVLLMYLLRDSRTRESKYRETIDELVRKLGVLNDVRENVNETLAIVRGREKRRARERRESAGAECEAADV